MKWAAAAAAGLVLLKVVRVCRGMQWDKRDGRLTDAQTYTSLLFLIIVYFSIILFILK